MAVTEPTSRSTAAPPDPAPGATASTATAAAPKGASMGTTAVELKDLVVAYAKQETLYPLKALGRFVAFGALGAVLLAVGTVLGALAIVRAVQTETAPHLAGDLSWVPYTGGILFALLVAGAAATRIVKAP